MFDNEIKPERAIAIAFARKGSDRILIDEHLSELNSLADTAGADVVETYFQELDKLNAKTLIGKGKVEEVSQYIKDNEIQLVVFDDDLTPAQVKNLEKAFEVKVIDRSGLILDIFAKHARTIEAKTQVDLAQSQYLLPRLTRMWTHLSKQFGGIGTRGPGETQIETDRRLLKLRIQNLKERLIDISVQKEQQRKNRSEHPRFALVGYTNAGKSTLMNTLTEANVYVEDKLFATLDTTVRAFSLPNGEKALLSDTVGFIRKLPANLIASFESTLAEAIEADILVNLVDVTYPYFKEHIEVVRKTLETLKILDKPIILAFNKIDLLEDRSMMASIQEQFADSVFISAGRGINIGALLELFQRKLDERNKKYHFMLPYSSMGQISKLYSLADIKKREDKDEGILLDVDVRPEKHDQFTNTFKEFF